MAQMMAAPAAPAGAEQAAELRKEMVYQLNRDGCIRSWFVRDAMSRVPREVFMPRGTRLEDAYSGAVVTKTSTDGRSLSSVNSPRLQARMISQAGLQPGMSVLEVGSGGCNAALLTEVVGPSGLVVSMDIDPQVTRRALACLDAAGYGGRVVLVTGDAEHGVSRLAPFDAILVTASAWDLPPAWRDQLAPGGTLVAPLRFNGVTWCLGLRRQGNRWVSTSSHACGLDPLQGIGKAPGREFVLPHPGGGRVRLAFEDEAPDALRVAPGWLGAEATSAWTAVAVPRRGSFAELQLWLAGLPGFCRVAAEDGIRLAGTPGTGRGWGWLPFGLLVGDSLAYLGLRPAAWESRGSSELGAWAYGPDAKYAANVLASAIGRWNTLGRSLPESAFTYWPAGTAPAAPPDGPVAFSKRHGAATIGWT